MSYQKCPVCNGSGSVLGWHEYTNAVCPTCRGSRIIDEATGLPPYSMEPRTSTGTGLTIFYDEKTGEYKDHNGENMPSSLTVKNKHG